MKRKVGLLVSGLFAVALFTTALHASGFCFSRFRYLDGRQLVGIAVAEHARYIDEIANEPAERLSAAMLMFLQRHPDCCAVIPDPGVSSMPLQWTAGSSWVRIQYKRRKQDVESPADGEFYDAFVEVGPCGEIFRSVGSREQQTSAKSFLK
jgi:hypothetical protein